jgi:flagellar motility protein MotE (MotC chaperone)
MLSIIRFGFWFILIHLSWNCAIANENLDSKPLQASLANQANYDTATSPIKSNIANISATFSNPEVEVLNMLSQRKKKILLEEAELKNKELTLRAIEQNVEKKIKDLELLREKVQKESAILEEKEDEKVKSLVKIYENMNPRRAAQIFDEIELDTLMKIVCAMKEIKISAILANMEISKAKELSVALTKRTTSNGLKISYE